MKFTHVKNLKSTLENFGQPMKFWEKVSMQYLFLCNKIEKQQRIVFKAYFGFYQKVLEEYYGKLCLDRSTIFKILLMQKSKK